MSLTLIFLLSMCRFDFLLCEIQDNPALIANSIDETHQPTESGRTVITNDVRLLPDLITSINIDYANNALILHFRKGGQFSNMDDKSEVLLDKNFMRFGRVDSALMRFGKRQVEFLDTYPEPQGTNGNSARDSRGDNFMRFGRSDNYLPYFTRSYPHASRNFNSGDSRFEHMMRFERGADSGTTQYGRDNRDFMRFGRENEMIRPSRSDGFMRLGRARLQPADGVDSYANRLTRNDKNFMRFGKLDQNFMRFGKREKETKFKSLDHGKSIKDNIWKTADSPTTYSKLDKELDKEDIASLFLSQHDQF